MSAAAGTADPTVRDAGPHDAAAIAGIYAHHVLNGLASFEEVAPDEAEHRRRMDRVRASALPYLVAEIAGTVRGYAYALPYRDRSAYRYTVEESIYIDAAWRGCGIASALMPVLIARCTEAGMRQLVAVIGDSANAASIGFHARHGFRHAGTLPSVGYKFGRWVDSVIMTRALGEGDRSAPG